MLDTLIIFILFMRKTSFRDIKQLVWNHTASNWQSWVCNPSLISMSMLLTTQLDCLPSRPHSSPQVYLSNTFLIFHKEMTLLVERPWHPSCFEPHRFNLNISFLLPTTQLSLLTHFPTSPFLFWKMHIVENNGVLLICFFNMNHTNMDLGPTAFPPEPSMSKSWGEDR